MDAEPLLERILDDESVRGDLDDEAAMLLLDWLAARVRKLADTTSSEAAARKEVDALARRGRAISRLVVTWCSKAERSKLDEIQRQAGVAWSLPDPAQRESVAVLRSILEQEDRSRPA